MVTKEMLERLYIQEEMAMNEIARCLGISVGTVLNYLKKFGIESRPKMTEKTKQKISKALMGKPSARKGCRLSEETKKKISKKRKGQILKPSEFGGHKKHRKDGYISVFCPSHPMATKEGFVMEHILVMEKAIGRYITRDEVVHHKNHIRDDNRIENLELMSVKDHARLHMTERWKSKKEKSNE